MGAGLSSAQKKEVEAALSRAATSKALRLTRKELKLLPEAVFTTHADLVQVDLSSNLLAALPPHERRDDVQRGQHDRVLPGYKYAFKSFYTNLKISYFTSPTD